MAARMQQVQKFKGIQRLERDKATEQLLPWDKSLPQVTIATVIQFIGLPLCNCPKKWRCVWDFKLIALPCGFSLHYFPHIIMYICESPNITSPIIYIYITLSRFWHSGSHLVSLPVAAGHSASSMSTHRQRHRWRSFVSNGWLPVNACRDYGTLMVSQILWRPLLNHCQFLVRPRLFQQGLDDEMSTLWLVGCELNPEPVHKKETALIASLNSELSIGGCDHLKFPKRVTASAYCSLREWRVKCRRQILR